MSQRILSLWFPHLAAERVLRQHRGQVAQPLAIIKQTGNALTVSCLSLDASGNGLSVGQSLSDARALCPDLLTVSENPLAEAAFLRRLRRWAGKYSPWVAQELPASLVINISGCAHLFGGELGMSEAISQDLERLRLSARFGIADTPGAAWALARFAGARAGAHRTGDAVDQEAHATRSRAFKRRNWERGGPAPLTTRTPANTANIAPQGKTRASIDRLPVAALRLEHSICSNLNRMGIRIIADLIGLPRATIVRRFGQVVVQRLDQALGSDPEPVSPAKQIDHFATRLTLPDPIGLYDDVLAGLDRLLPPLCVKLATAGRGARTLQLSCFRTDRSVQMIEVSLARPSNDPDRIRPLLTLRLSDIDAGFGIDVMRLHVVVSEPLKAQQHSGHMTAVNAAQKLRDDDTDVTDLLGRIGARIGLEQMIRLHPANSNIPEKAATFMAALYAEPAQIWPHVRALRPITYFPPELVHTQNSVAPPYQFRWRGRDYQCVSAIGPERIAPEWWLDDPNWRGGTRDYWRVKTLTGEQLWLYETRNSGLEQAWFCQGDFE